MLAALPNIHSVARMGRPNLRRAFPTFLSLIFLLFLPTGRAEGGGYVNYGLGNKAGSMGYAFIGLADDATAIYWNPAGLTQMKHPEIMGDFWYMYEYDYRDRDSVANRDPSRERLDPRRGDFFFALLPREPGRFKEGEIVPPLAFMADVVGQWKWKGFNFGAGYYVPIGTSLDWRDDVHGPGIRMDGRIHNMFFMAVNNLSVAKELTPKLSAGVGFNFLWGKMNQDIHKAFLDRQDPRNSYSQDMELNGWGRGVEGVFGLLYKPFPWFQVGGVYRTGGTMNFTGRATGEHSLLSPREGADFIWKLYHPPTWGMGLALRPHARLLLTFDWQRIEWTKADIYFNFRRHTLPQPFLFRDIMTDLHWKSENNFSVGLEYQHNEKWQGRMGYGAVHSPSHDDGSGIGTLAVVQDVPTITFGLNYSPGTPWSYGFHLEHHFASHSPSVDHNCLVVGFGISRKF